MDQSQQSKTRNVYQEERGFELTKVVANATALLQVIKHAASEASERGWGKLLGYYDVDNKSLEVEKSYPLVLPKPDEKMRKEDNNDDLLKKKITEFSYNYRQVGFYIFSEDDDIYTFNILNYLINNEKFGNARTFLHFSTFKAKTGKNPFTFYDVSDAFNRALIVQSMENNKIVFDVKEESITSMDPKTDKIYTPLPFEVLRSPVFDLMASKCDASLFKLLENKNDAPQERNELLTKSLNELLNRQAFLIHNHIQNKKVLKQSSTVNLYGGLVRAQAVLEHKRELLDDISCALENIGKLINE